jgi:hypothetical protein
MLTRIKALVAAADGRSFPAALLIAMTSAFALSCGGGDVTTPTPATVTITLGGAGRGTVTSSPAGITCSNATGAPASTCSAQFSGQVTLTAAPETGSTFTGWSGDASGCGSNTGCTITVSTATNITATFDAPTGGGTLTIVGGGSGSGRLVSDPTGIDCTITGGNEADTGCSFTFTNGETVTLAVQAGTLQGFGGACNGTTCSVTMTSPQTVIATFAPDAPATKLGFVGQPGAVQTGQPITPAVQVAIQDASGGTVVSRTDAVTLQLQNNPGGATLGGTLTRNAVGGVATFDNITLDQVGDNYTLTATASGLTSATSNGFNVSAAPVAQLAFAAALSTTKAGDPIAGVRVEIRDQGGTLLTGRTDQITVQLKDNPAATTLHGTTTVAAVGGVATFSDLSVQIAAAGYSLSASTANASGATSSQFEIIPGDPKLLVLVDGQSQSAVVSTKVLVRPSIKILDAFNNPVPNVPVKWEVTAGGGSVVASTTDPVNRPTGPLGMSTAVSWTLGPDPGTNNNELRATATGANINGNPFTFRASGTLPPNTSIFKGLLREIGNGGFVPPAGGPIGNATLTFTRLSDGGTAGQATTKSDGTFSSPPLPAGVEFKIDIVANTFKETTLAKPALVANSPFLLNNLGMVKDGPGGASTLNITVNLDPAPQSAIDVRVEIYAGDYTGDSGDPDFEPLDQLTINTTGGDDAEMFPTDWGVMTVLVIADGYQTARDRIVVDTPNGKNGETITLIQ